MNSQLLCDLREFPTRANLTFSFTGIKSSEAFIRSSAYSHRFVKIRFKTAFEISRATSHAILIFFEAKLDLDGSKK